MFNLLLNLFAIFISLANCLILDRAQLTEWYPDYATSSIFNLATREIDSIEETAFSGLVQSKIIYLHDNEVASISETLLNDLVNLEEIYMHFNQLNYMHPRAFWGLNNLKKLWLQGNQLNSVDTSLL